MTWPMVKLSDVCQVNPRLPKTYDENQEVSFLAMASVSEDGKLLTQETRTLGETKKGFTYFERGDVIVAKITPCFENGKAVYLEELNTQIGFGSTEFHVLRPDTERLNGKYLFYLIWNSKFRSIAERSMSGSAGQKRVPADFFKNFEIPLPPLEEQKRIAAILDKADAIRQKRQQAIALADQFLRSVFLDMFGDPVTNPKGWEIKPLKEDIHNANNGISRRRKEENNVGDIVLRLQDIHYDGIQFNKELNRIPLDNNEKERFKVNVGDILFVRVNGNPDYVGRSAVFNGYSEDVYHNDHIIRIKVSSSFEPGFLSYLFNSPGGRKIIAKKTKTSAGQHTISQGGIEELEIYRPPKEEQKIFTKIMSELMSVVDHNFKSDELNIGLFAVLSQKAFSGQL